MELIDSKCPNCGAEVKLNREEKTAICTHCNSSFLVDDAIKKYVTNNSYNIAHATIIRNDSVDDDLYNEIDKYIAQYNLKNYDKLEDIVENLKDKFPHKGLARIAILHYDFVLAFCAIGDEQKFHDEADTIEEKFINYTPKKYKHTPPYTPFLSKLDNIEHQYAEDLDDLLTDNDKSTYDDLVNTTLGYLKKYNRIIFFNKKMCEKYEPFENTLAQKVLKREKKKQRSQKFKKHRLLIIFVVVLVALAIALSSHFIGINNIRSKRSYFEAYNVERLSFPIQATTSGNVTLEYGNTDVLISKRAYYTITGRVAGKHSFLQVGVKNKVLPVIVGLSWGEYSSKELSQKIQWKYSIFSNSTSYKILGPDLKSNFSTNMLIPANDEVRDFLKAIKENDIIQIEGFLADVSFVSEKKTSTMATSTSLTEDNLAEIIYVTSIKWCKEK